MNSRLPKTSISALFLSTALVIATALPLQGQSTSYVPALQARDGADLGLALVNPTLSDAKVTLSVINAIGKTRRTLNGPTTAGLHRIAWDLNEPVVAQAGKYRASLAKVVKGTSTPLGEPVEFELVPLPGAK